MKRFSFGLFVLLASVAMVGCDGSGETGVAYEKSELEKYVEENPVPLVGEDDMVTGMEDTEE